MFVCVCVFDLLVVVVVFVSCFFLFLSFSGQEDLLRDSNSHWPLQVYMLAQKPDGVEKDWPAVGQHQWDPSLVGR